MGLAASVGDAGDASGPAALRCDETDATGHDNNMWFVEEGTNKIGRITSTGAITEFDVPTAGGHPDLITTGPDGNLWLGQSVTAEVTNAGWL
jgi:streptogramin lyase